MLIGTIIHFRKLKAIVCDYAFWAWRAGQYKTFSTRGQQLGTTKKGASPRINVGTDFIRRKGGVYDVGGVNRMTSSTYFRRHVVRGISSLSSKPGLTLARGGVIPYHSCGKVIHTVWCQSIEAVRAAWTEWAPQMHRKPKKQTCVVPTRAVW